MSGISSGIGLISGINFNDLIDNLIAIERRPIDNLQTRVNEIGRQRTAFVELSAQLLAIKNSALGFSSPSFFQQFTSSSTDESVLRATAGEDAVAGTHTFRVRSLVTNQALITRGFADRDVSPIGTGTLTIDSVKSRVNRDTNLDSLNGGAGVRRGVFTITDRSGSTAEIDLSTALTVQDVLDAINTNPDVRVRASVTGVAAGGATGDRIVIEDVSGASGSLIVADPGDGSTAADLGIAGTAAADRIDGGDLVRLTASTALTQLNDGNGVGRFRLGTDLVFSTALGDFNVSLTSNLTTQTQTDLRALNSGQGVRLGVIRITDKGGASARIDLSGAQTVQDVLDAINNAAIGVSATVITAGDKSFFQLSDTTGVTGGDENPAVLKVEDVSGFTAADLGLVGEGDVISGRGVYRVETIGDVINAINLAPGNTGLVEASISTDGNGISIRALGLNNTVTISAGVDAEGRTSSAAADLGLLGVDAATTFATRDLIAGLNTVLLSSLRGGAGISRGEIRLTDRSGATATVDLSQARTLQDVIDLINGQAAMTVRASVNRSGNGIALRDESGGTGALVVEDVTGGAAADLGIAGIFPDAAGGDIDGGNLQMQYISRLTSLDDLNGGRGVSLGVFQITDSNGTVHIVDLSAGVVQTMGDVIDAVNRATPDGVQARINDTGDGLVIVDNGGGTQSLRIEDRDGSRTASDLKIAGDAAPGKNFIDGSMEIRIDVGASDTLDELAQRINNAGNGVAASIFDSGGTSNRFSLTLTSQQSGRRGEMVVDTTGFDLGFSTLTRAQDAVISLGDGGSGASRLISSSTNTVENVVPGVTLDLLSTSDNPVTVSVAQDVNGIVDAIRTFADTFNGALDSIDQNTRFDSETLDRGPLFGDPTVDLVRNRLIRLMTQPFQGVDASVSRLFSVGLRIGNGNRLQFDEERFRQVYDRSPESVQQLFTDDDNGLAAVLSQAVDALTRDSEGVVSRQDQLLQDQQKIVNDRIEALNVLLEAKRSRLEAQFVALESSLAGLQNQQNALASLSQLAQR